MWAGLSNPCTGRRKQAKRPSAVPAPASSTTARQAAFWASTNRTSVLSRSKRTARTEVSERIAYTLGRDEM